MSAWAIARFCVLGVLASSWALGGCALDDGSASSGGSYAGGAGSSSSGGSSSGSGQTMLVDVDPNQTMSVNAGDGVGVFTEYQSGGHWHVYWTCDTNKTSLPCSFDVTVSVSTGTFANMAGQGAVNADTIARTSTQIEATTTTTTEIDGLTFDTVVPAGTTPIITLDAKMDGAEDPTFLFFVQNGKINGNYGGTLTDPLMLEPSTP
jgi:hypothetical protein